MNGLREHRNTVQNEENAKRQQRIEEKLDAILALLKPAKTPKTTPESKPEPPTGT